MMVLDEEGRMWPGEWKRSEVRPEAVSLKMS